MSRTRFEGMHCGVAQALERVGDWWSLLIVRDAFLGLSRFAQFEASLGISKNILSDRLHKLVEHGILERERRNEPGNRFDYKLTRKGRDLWLVLTAMRLWSDRWVFGDDEVPMFMRERDTGRRVAGLLAVDENGEPIDPRKLEWVAGPGLPQGLGGAFDHATDQATDYTSDSPNDDSTGQAMDEGAGKATD